MGCKNLWPTLVHVHIATGVLETLHPGATGLCFMIKVWLVTLGLTNSLSTSNFSEMVKNVHVFLIDAVNSLMSNDGEILILTSFYMYVYY